MTMKNILALAGAIVVGIIIVKVAGAILGFVIGLLGWLFYAAIVAGVVYFLYRVFSNSLGAGRRLHD
jgi:hypothetical protein